MLINLVCFVLAVVLICAALLCGAFIIGAFFDALSDNDIKRCIKVSLWCVLFSASLYSVVDYEFITHKATLTQKYIEQDKRYISGVLDNGNKFHIRSSIKAYDEAVIGEQYDMKLSIADWIYLGINQ